MVSAQKAFDRAVPRRVTADEGNTAPVEDFEKPKYWEMQDAIVVKGIAVGKGFRGEEGGFQPERNPYFKKYTTRTMRPVVDFDKCVKCTLCWLQCPDSCFDVTPEHLYDANMEACCGCGVCEAVCPVDNCITMVNETAFADNTSQYEMWKQDAQVTKGGCRRRSPRRKRSNIVGMASITEASTTRKSQRCRRRRTPRMRADTLVIPQETEALISGCEAIAQACASSPMSTSSPATPFGRMIP